LLFQGNGSVAEYAAKFENLAPLTNLSDEDLRQHFYEHLTDHVKDRLALTDKDISMYELVKAAAMVIDQRLHERQSKVRSNPFQTRPSTQSNWQPTATAMVLVVDPNAMQVDTTFAGRSARVGDSFQQEWMAGMRGHCYRCDDNQHVKAQCLHGQSLCSWCGQLGHLNKVCFQKVLGKPQSATPQGALAAAHSNNPFVAQAVATNPFQAAPSAPTPISPLPPSHSRLAQTAARNAGTESGASGSGCLPPRVGKGFLEWSAKCATVKDCLRDQSSGCATQWEFV
jgi:hypothetical protein